MKREERNLYHGGHGVTRRKIKFSIHSLRVSACSAPPREYLCKDYFFDYAYHMSELLCAVCGKGKGPEKCEVCGFSYEGKINETFLTEKELNYWLETVVNPYRSQWEDNLLAQLEESRKREADLSAQLETARNNEAELRTRLEEIPRLKRELEEARRKQNVKQIKFCDQCGSKLN